METKSEFRSRATIRDVSRVAEVSIKTVSRVINNEKYVSPETRARIERVMTELAFQPSFAARALAGHRSHQIAIICDNPSAWYVYEIQHGTRLRCQQDGVRMIAQPYDRGSPNLVQDIVSLVDQVHPDGIVLTPPVCDNPEVLNELRRREVPFVRVQPRHTHAANLGAIAAPFRNGDDRDRRPVSGQRPRLCTSALLFCRFVLDGYAHHSIAGAEHQVG